MIEYHISLSRHLDIIVISTKFQRVTGSDINSKEEKMRGNHYVFSKTTMHFLIELCSQI